MKRASSSAPRLAPSRNYLLAALVVAAVALLGAPLLGQFDLANIAMLFPLAVLFAAIRLGRGPAVFAAFLAVALFDFFFVHPHFTLAVSDLQYLLTFAVLLAVAPHHHRLTQGNAFKMAQVGGQMPGHGIAFTYHPLVGHGRN